MFADGQSYQAQSYAGVSISDARIDAAEFDGCTFERCSFLSAALHGCRFSHSRFIECSFSAIQLPNCRFTDVTFLRSKMIGIDWTVTGGSPALRLPLAMSCTESVLDYSSFFGMDLRGVTLLRCRAREVDFSEADLRKVDCSGTDFLGSTFLHTNLERANFTDATSYAINPLTNSVKRARFSLPEAVALLRGLDIVIT